jgi:acyl transferase domain-containing protein
VLEIGPHRTLVGPLLQTARSCAPDLPLTALSTLKRQTDDVVALFTCLSQLMDQGYPVRLPRFYAQRSFIRLRGLPGHPFLRKPLRDYRTAEAPRLRTHYEDDVCGPCAGSKVRLSVRSPCRRPFLDEEGSCALKSGQHRV